MDKETRREILSRLPPEPRFLEAALINCGVLGFIVAFSAILVPAAQAIVWLKSAAWPSWSIRNVLSGIGGISVGETDFAGFNIILNWTLDQSIGWFVFVLGCGLAVVGMRGSENHNERVRLWRQQKHFEELPRYDHQD
jgi:hypothetical protein